MPAPAAPPMPPPPGPPRLRLDDKVLALDFRVLDAQFNEPGRYQLQLCVENPLLEGSEAGVKVSVNQGDILYSNQADSDVAEQGDLTDTLTFSKDTYLFILPQGLCKNDKHHDVRLCINALRFGGDPLTEGRRVGQALFAIYPRTNQPRINLRAAPFQPLYQYQGVMALLRVGGDQLAMHCGRLAYSVCFREYQPPQTEDTPPKPTSSLRAAVKPTTSPPATPRPDLYPSGPPKQAPQPGTPLPGPLLSVYNPSNLHHPQTQRRQQRTPSPEPGSSPDQDDLHSLHSLSDASDVPPSPSPVPLGSSRLPDDAPLLLPSPPQTPAPPRQTHVKEMPPAVTLPLRSAEGEFGLVSPPGTETVSVTLHAASYLPPTTDGSAPAPFITLMSSSDEQTGAGAQSISHAARSPAQSAAWGETLTMSVRGEEAEREELLLTVADAASRELLLTYRLPLRVLRPFHQYHLCMVQPHRLIPGGCHLYTSVLRRSSRIAQQRHFTYSALQVLLLGMDAPLQGSVSPVIAVGRIVPNCTDYSQSQKPPGLCGVSPLTVLFPDPAPSNFQIPQRATHGHPQVSPPGLPPSQPVWNSSFLFQGRDGVTLFSEGAALILEYYPVTAAERVPWNLSDSCGFSVVPLNLQVYQQLITDSDSRGHTLHGVPIQGTDLRTITGEAASVSLQLLLLNSERPELFLKPAEVPSSPPWDPQSNPSPPPTQGDRGTQRRGELQRDGHSLPSHHALANILPDPRPPPARLEQKPTDQEGLRRPPPNFQHLSNDVELPGDSVMEHQEQELENYRLAMQRMADDLIALRRQHGALEAENSALRSERSLHQEAGRSLLSDADLDVMTKAELADRLVTLKQKLASETSELRGVRDRVQQLQNELVRRNDREKELVLLQRAHQQQQTVLAQYRDRLNRARTLQDTIRQQEKVIERMEKALDSKLREQKRSRAERGERGGREESLRGEVHASLLAENTRLREELEKATCTPIILQHSAPLDALSDGEKLSLLSKLEKSQTRAQTLERELEESARLWGREKQQLLTRFSEQEMGFSRTRTTILHHSPTKVSDVPPRRHAKLDPLL